MVLEVEPVGEVEEGERGRGQEEQERRGVHSASGGCRLLEAREATTSAGGGGGGKRKEEELEQLVMTSVWGLKPGSKYICNTLSRKWYICKQIFCKFYSRPKSFLVTRAAPCVFSGGLAKVNQSQIELNEAFSLLLISICLSFPFPREK